jgi:hypothetical protein
LGCGGVRLGRQLKIIFLEKQKAFIYPSETA